jgi:hypothetical protein
MFGNCAKVERRRSGGSPRGKREQRAYPHMVFRIFDSLLEAVIEVSASKLENCTSRFGYNGPRNLDTERG